MGYRYKEHVYKPKPEAKTKNKNAPYKHSVATGHTIDYEGIELINRADSNFKLCIKEKFLFFVFALFFVDKSLPCK